MIISGPSGVGKSTILKEIFARRKNLYFSVSATTRPPREGETDGVHYHFLSVEKFQEWIADHNFLEYAEYVGDFYGTPKKYAYEAMDAGRDVILDIEIQGAEQVKKSCPEAVSVFIAPPDWNELKRRLSERGTDSPEKIQKRLLRAKVEFQSAGMYDYLLINDDLKESVKKLDAIITAEHCRTKELLKYDLIREMDEL